MNILKKIPFISIIIFMIVLHVHSEIDKGEGVNDSECINAGGQCMSIDNCNGDIKYNICSSDNLNVCCIIREKEYIPKAKPPRTKSVAKISNDIQCINQGGECINSNNSCLGVIQYGICSDSSLHCCFTNYTAFIHNITNDSSCTSEGGECMNPMNCIGAVISGLCPGGADNKCCISKPKNKSVIQNSNSNNNNQNNNSNNNNQNNNSNNNNQNNNSSNGNKYSTGDIIAAVSSTVAVIFIILFSCYYIYNKKWIKRNITSYNNEELPPSYNEIPPTYNEAIRDHNYTAFGNNVLNQSINNETIGYNQKSYTEYANFKNNSLNQSTDNEKVIKSKKLYAEYNDFKII